MLYFNAIWLTVLYFRQRVRIRRGFLGDESAQAAREVQKASRWWVVNNTICASLLITLLFATDYIGVPYILTIIGIVAIANTVIDYLGTRNFYFPLARS